MRRLTLLTALALLALAAPAHALTFTSPDGSVETAQGWVTSAPVPTPDMTLTLRYGAAAVEAGCAVGCSVAWDFCNDSQGCWSELTLWMGTLDRSVLFHELGHVFDKAKMTDALRTRYARIFHRAYWGPGAWWAHTGEDRALVEWFAESYRLCAIYPHRRPSTIFGDSIGYRYAPRLAQQERACALIREAGA